MIANIPSIDVIKSPAAALPFISPDIIVNVLIIAFICNPRYGIMPTTATIVTSAERKRDLPYLDPIKSDTVVILFAFASLTIFFSTTSHMAAMRVGPMYVVRNDRPEVAALPTLP